MKLLQIKLKLLYILSKLLVFNIIMAQFIVIDSEKEWIG
jgi:hypothetical protein